MVLRLPDKSKSDLTGGMYARTDEPTFTAHFGRSPRSTEGAKNRIVNALADLESRPEEKAPMTETRRAAAGAVTGTLYHQW